MPNYLSEVELPSGEEYQFKDKQTRTNIGLEGNLMSKTYTGIIGEANNAAGATFYAIKVVPDDYDKNWFIRYRITAEIKGISEANGLGYKSSDVYICGMKSTYANYWVWNTIRNTSYQAYGFNSIYRAKAAGVTNKYGHVIGVGLRDSWNRLTAANSRTITVEILDYGDCTVSLFNQMLLYADLPGTGTTNYDAITEFNGNTQGFTRSGTDANNYDRTVLYGAAIKAESAIVAGNVIVAGTSGHYHHLKLGTPFDITYPILYASKAIAANANSNSDTYISYMFNLDTTQAVTLTTQLPVFIKGQLDGTVFTPVSTTPCTQTIPTTEDGYEYIYLGQAYAANNIVLSYVHPIFAYRNGKWTEVAGDASSVNGFTVAKDVPSDAKFTDTNYHTPRCTTGAANAAKTAACADYVLLKDSYIPLLVINTNTANSALTLNINSTGAKPIWINGAASSSSNHTLPGGMYFVYYDGSKYYFRTDGLIQGKTAASTADDETLATTAYVKSAIRPSLLLTTAVSNTEITKSVTNLANYSLFLIEYYAGSNLNVFLNSALVSLAALKSQDGLVIRNVSIGENRSEVDAVYINYTSGTSFTLSTTEGVDNRFIRITGLL